MYLYRVPESVAILVTVVKQHPVNGKLIYDALCPDKVVPRPVLHAPSSAGITGHTQREGTTACLKAFLEASDDEISALGSLGVAVYLADQDTRC